MTRPELSYDRARLLDALARLGSDDEETVLAAARAAGAVLATTGLGWDDLLPPAAPVAVSEAAIAAPADDAGRIAQHTGSGPKAWAGHLHADNVSVAGNILANERVAGDTLATWLARSELGLEQRLLAAMDAGEAAGGDSRGKESAAMLIWADQEWPELDLRVDNHPDPLRELRRLVHESTRRFTTFRRFLATRQDPAGCFDRPVLDRKVAEAEAAFREP